MRRYLDIDLATRAVSEKPLDGEDLVNVGRHFIAKTLVQCGAAKADPRQVTCRETRKSYDSCRRQCCEQSVADAVLVLHHRTRDLAQMCDEEPVRMSDDVLSQLRFS